MYRIPTMFFSVLVICIHISKCVLSTSLCLLKTSLFLAVEAVGGCFTKLDTAHESGWENVACILCKCD